MSLHAGPQNSAWADVASLILISLKFGLNRKWSHSKVHHKGKSRVFFLQLQLQHIETGLQSSAQHIKTTGYLNSLQTA